MHRSKTREVKVGNLTLGGNNKVYIQSMTNTKTHDVDATVNQINSLTELGCEYKIAVLNRRDRSIGKLKKNNYPFFADIHFDYNSLEQSRCW